MRINLRSRAALLLAAGLVLAACGSSAKTASKNSAGTSTSAVGGASTVASGPAITVGAMCSCSGVQAGTSAELNNVLQAWAKWTNAHGGLNGHPVNLIAKDDGGDPATALTQLKELTGPDRAVAIIDDSLVDASWASYAQQQAVPVLGGTNFETPFLSSPNFYGSGGSTVAPPLGILKEAASIGSKTMGVLYCAETPVCQQSGVLLKVIQAATNTPVATKLLAVSATTPSYNSECLSLKDAGVTTVFPVLGATTIRRFVDQCAAIGYKPKFLISAPSFVPSFLTDPLFDGSYIAASNANYVDSSIPGVKTFLAAIDQFAPSVKTSPAFSFDTIYPWLGGQLLVAAAKAGAISATATSADIKAGLYALHGETLDGLAQPLTYTPNQPTVLLCWFDLGIKSGQLVTAGSGQPQCLPDDQNTALVGGLKKLLGG